MRQCCAGATIVRQAGTGAEETIITLCVVRESGPESRRVSQRRVSPERRRTQRRTSDRRRVSERRNPADRRREADRRSDGAGWPLDDETAVEHIRNALQILSTGMHAGYVSNDHRAVLSSTMDRLRRALAALENKA